MFEINKFIHSFILCWGKLSRGLPRTEDFVAVCAESDIPLAKLKMFLTNTWLLFSVGRRCQWLLMRRSIDTRDASVLTLSTSSLVSYLTAYRLNSLFLITRCDVHCHMQSVITMMWWSQSYRKAANQCALSACSVITMISWSQS